MKVETGEEAGERFVEGVWRWQRGQSANREGAEKEAALEQDCLVLGLKDGAQEILLTARTHPASLTVVRGPFATTSTWLTAANFLAGFGRYADK